MKSTESLAWQMLHGARIDRAPVASWRHFYQSEWNADALAEALIDFQADYEWDLIKLNYRATFYAEAWGLKAQPGPNNHCKGSNPVPPFHSAENLPDLLELQELPGSFLQQLSVLQLVRGRFPGLPVVSTCFNAISVLADLFDGDEIVNETFVTQPNWVHQSLEAINRTLIRFGHQAIRLGADGIFFATTEWAEARTISWRNFLEFVLPYDQEFLQKVKAPWNIFHVCGGQNYLPSLLTLDVAGFSWDPTLPGNPSLMEAAEKTDRILMGGLSRQILEEATPAEVSNQAQKALQEIWPHRFILAPGCTARPTVPPANLHALREAVCR
jgi:uroporphyrinogen decarboxylase